MPVLLPLLLMLTPRVGWGGGKQTETWERRGGELLMGSDCSLIFKWFKTGTTEEGYN